MFPPAGVMIEGRTQSCSEASIGNLYILQAVNLNEFTVYILLHQVVSLETSKQSQQKGSFSSSSSTFFSSVT